MTDLLNNTIGTAFGVVLCPPVLVQTLKSQNLRGVGRQPDGETAPRAQVNRAERATAACTKSLPQNLIGTA